MKRPARVLHVVPWLHSGGVERRRLQLARSLDKDRFEQRVVCLHGLESLIGEYEAAGTRVDAVGGNGSLGDFPTIARVTRIARAWRPHIIHGAVFEGVTVAAVGGTLARVPRIIVEEIDFPLHRTWRGRLLFRALAARADRCVAVSPAVAAYLQGTGGVSAKKIRLIVNGVAAPNLPPVEDRASIRTALGIQQDAIVVGSVGRVHDDHKRFSDLIRMMVILRATHPRVHLLIVGDGPDRASLEALASDLGVRETVAFAGYRPHTGPMYRAMDVFALASNRESFGLVLVEAMFSELPVVATRTGGIPNVVADGETGVLVPVGEPVSLAREVSRLVDRPDERARLGAAGRRRATEHFSHERYVADVARLYEELL